MRAQYASLQARIDAANLAGNKAVDAARNAPGTDKDRQTAVTNATNAWQSALTPLFTEGAKTFGDALAKALAGDAAQRRNAAAIGLDPNKLNTSMTSQIQTAGSLSDYFRGQLTAQGLNATHDTLEAQDKVLEAQKSNIDEAKKASAQLLQTYEDAYNRQKAQYGMSLLAESNFWRSRISAFAKNSKEYAEVFSRANEPINKLFAGTEQAYRDRSGTAPQMQSRSSDADTVAIARGLEQQASLNAAITEATTKYKLEIGAIDTHTAALDNAGAHTDEYKAKIFTLTTELAKLHSEEMDVNGVNVDPANAAKQQEVQNQINQLNGQRQIQTLTDTQATLSTTWVGMIDSVFDELIRKGQDTVSQIKAISTQLIGDVNNNIAKALTGGKTDWRKTFQQTGESLTKTGLGKLEGIGLKALGFGGGKRDGSSAGSALFVQMAGAGGLGASIPGLGLFGSAKPNVIGPGGAQAGKMASGATSGLLGMLNNSDWASGLMGGKLFGSGSFFGGGFATGGDVQAGVPIDVGEMGIERFTPSVPGHITPNKDLRGGHTYNIDARATDPVMVHAAVARANQQTYQRSVHDATRASAERSRRTPSK